MECDSDGDLIVQRQTSESEWSTEIILIEHTLSTRLLDVGLQVWSGSLLLCDYIIENRHAFTGKRALEFGGGMGLVSVVMAMYASNIICTDIGQDVLEMCQKNAERNKILYSALRDPAKSEDVIKVRWLDWTMESFSPDDCDPRFLWRSEDQQSADNCEILLAADVIYDDDLTSAFFKTVQRFLSVPPSKSLYLALERRLNFTLTDLEVSCPAYQYFTQCVSDLCAQNNESDIKYTAEQIDPQSFGQYFNYQRTKYLELWKVTCVVADKE